MAPRWNNPNAMVETQLIPVRFRTGSAQIVIDSTSF
jgi:hypothetical protein